MYCVEDVIVVHSLFCISIVRYPSRNCTGPLMFLLYINDIIDRVFSTLGLFADDCLLYQNIQYPQDSIVLQKNLDLLFHWASIW